MAKILLPTLYWVVQMNLGILAKANRSYYFSDIKKYLTKKLTQIINMFSNVTKGEEC